MRVSRKDVSLDLSQATPVTPAMDILFLNGYSIVVSWTGTPTGTLKLQGSNDAWDEDSVITGSSPENASATWVDIAGSSVSLTGSAGSFSWNAADQNYQAARLVYVRTGGTGALVGKWRGKSVQ